MSELATAIQTIVSNTIDSSISVFSTVVIVFVLFVSISFGVALIQLTVFPDYDPLKPSKPL
jgi:hypothetical protein